MVPFTWAQPIRLAPKFYCNECWTEIKAAWKAPMKGIDRPEYADDEWRPSLTDHVRHALIAIAFEERNNR